MLSFSSNKNSVSNHEERTEVTYLLIDDCRQQVVPGELQS
jgi:hypothetical protein